VATAAARAGASAAGRQWVVSAAAGGGGQRRRRPIVVVGAAAEGGGGRGGGGRWRAARLRWWGCLMARVESSIDLAATVAMKPEKARDAIWCGAWLKKCANGLIRGSLDRNRHSPFRSLGQGLTPLVGTRTAMPQFADRFIRRMPPL
jgi:hypothetical protein